MAGTCFSAASAACILAGLVRTDIGSMSAMYVIPARGSIVNSAELVNTMALEEMKPDSFIAGGLQLDDGGGMHAYLLRVNSLFHDVVYATRYRAQITSGVSRRRSLRGYNSRDSAVKSMVLVGNTLFSVINVFDTTEPDSLRTVCIAKLDAATGTILQQVSHCGVRMLPHRDISQCFE